MHITTAVAASALALATGASAMLAAPAQTQQPGPTTQQPGQMTEAHVWVDNRGRNQVVPVELSDEKLDHPLRVLIINGEPQYQPSNPVQVRPVRQLWDYRTVTLAMGEDMAKRLDPLGAAGWETTGITSVNGQGTTLLLKRPRLP